MNMMDDVIAMSILIMVVAMMVLVAIVVIHKIKYMDDVEVASIDRRVVVCSEY